MDYKLIVNESELLALEKNLLQKDWIAIDTEFIGEKRYRTLLCLIQIATDDSIYLIDTLQLEIQDFLKNIIANPKLLKLTHSGDNDYKLIFQLFEIIPQNVFDLQIAAGFLGFGYPISLLKLVKALLPSVQLDKSFSVIDWEKRPINENHIQYAIEDVKYLYECYHLLRKSLIKREKENWFIKEMKKWEHFDYYYKDPDLESIKNTMMLDISQNKQVFLLRLNRWKREQAQLRNISMEMFLPSKSIIPIVKNFDKEKKHLLSNRIISEKFVERYYDEMKGLMKHPITESEKEILMKIPLYHAKNTDETTAELLYIIVKNICIESDVSPLFIINKNDIVNVPRNQKIIDTENEEEWRHLLLGKQVTDWLNKRNKIKVQVHENSLELLM